MQTLELSPARRADTPVTSPFWPHLALSSTSRQLTWSELRAKLQRMFPQVSPASTGTASYTLMTHSQSQGPTPEAVQIAGEYGIRMVTRCFATLGEEDGIVTVGGGERRRWTLQLTTAILDGL